MFNISQHLDLKSQESDTIFLANCSTRLLFSCMCFSKNSRSIRDHITQEVAIITRNHVRLNIISVHNTLTMPILPSSSDWITFPLQFENIPYGSLYVMQSSTIVSLQVAEKLAQICTWLIHILEDATYIQSRRVAMEYEEWHCIMTLTQREIEVLKLMIGGYDTNKIAENLVLCKRTVERHQRHIYEHLGVSSSQEAILLGLVAGLA